MAKVITFSRKFPKKHINEGEPTFFVEKFYNSIEVVPTIELLTELNPHLTRKQVIDFYNSLNFYQKDTKYTTIRNGKRFKKGDFFSPRVWGNDINPKSGRRGPYHSKQIILYHDIEIKKEFDFEIKNNLFFVNKQQMSVLQSFGLSINDGLKYRDFLSWFKYPKPFSGQIICWNNNVEY